MDISYEWIYSNFIVGNPYYEDLIKKCSELYSTQYGKWSHAAGQHAGQNVKLSPARIHEWLESGNSSLYYAQDREAGNMLVGYAIAIQLNVPKCGVISWVTQLVVHEDYRHQEIAKNLLHSIWGFTDHFAWGIISANPYAVRALEKTTRRRTDPVRIKHNLKRILSIGIENLPYINEQTEAFVTNEISKINTEFYVDHSDVESMIENVVTDTVPWTLGHLDEGWEWLAFTFRDQLPFSLTESEIRNMLNVSDSIVQAAYKRMDLTESQLWTRHTKEEVDFIFKECGLRSGDSVIDFGCGQGRHCLELAICGIDVVGIDYVDKNIEIANKKKAEKGIDCVNFVIGDCRSVEVSPNATAAICLYDVIGSYADNVENIKILENIFRHLKPGGIALISVMNYHMTYAQAKYKFQLSKNPNEILSIKPNNIMETTGNIFDPEYYLVDTETGVIYRREQFRHGRALPAELIVRDKRFTLDEIKGMCEQVGFVVEFTRFVNARNWDIDLEATHTSAKEILIKCRKDT